MEPSAAGREEARASQFQFHRWSHAMDQRHEASGQEIEWRRHRVVRSAFQSQRAVAGGGQQSRQDGLQDQRGAAGCADRKPVVARRHGPRPKLQRLRTQGCSRPPRHNRPSLAASTAVRCCFSRPGFWRLARIRSIRKGWPVTRDSANDVRRIWPPPSPCEPSMVIIDQSSARSPCGAIFTSLGSNWPRMVTRSFCAAMTSWMFL